MRRRLVRRRRCFSSRWKLRLPTTNFLSLISPGRQARFFCVPAAPEHKKPEAWGLGLRACARVRVRARIGLPCGAAVSAALNQLPWNRAGETPAPQTLPGEGATYSVAVSYFSSNAWNRGWSRRGSQTGSRRSMPTERSHGMESNSSIRRSASSRSPIRE